MRLTSAYSLVRADHGSRFDFSGFPEDYKEDLGKRNLWKSPNDLSGNYSDSPSEYGPSPDFWKSTDKSESEDPHKAAMERLKGVDPYEALERSGLADPYLYEDKPYKFTGKFGVNFKSLKTAFEYSYMNEAEEMEERIWVDEDGEVTPD